MLNLRYLKNLKKVLNPREKLILKASYSVIGISILFLAWNFLASHIQTIPKEGGEYTEALVGSPKYINPLYASLSDVDSDLSSLIFSSLFKRDVNGGLKEDLVQSYEISEDGLTYTFKIKDNIFWHNGEVLTADDIVYTFNAIKDAQYQSPLRSSFSGVQIEKIDDHSLRFLLGEKYAAFLDLLDFGILPQHLWYSVPPASAGLAELNLKPIGSGPYQFKSLAKDKLGAIKLYSLTANVNYYNGAPKITDLSFKFFLSFEEAINGLNSNLVNGISYLPLGTEAEVSLKEHFNFSTLNLSQLTAVFFNQAKNPNLKTKEVRQALNQAIDQKKIIEDLGGSYRLIDGPILPTNFAYSSNNVKYNYDFALANELLDKAGWDKIKITRNDLASSAIDSNASSTSEELIEQEMKQSLGAGEWRYKDTKDGRKYLTVELATVDLAENLKVVNNIKTNWEAIGVKTFIKAVPAIQIQSDIIKPRAFEALFYGEALGADPDVYAFWHSSQAGEKGFNLSDYNNKEADKLLESGRTNLNQEERIEAYRKFQTIITEDLAAIFLYSPTYVYVQDKKIKGFGVKNILTPSDRFSDIDNWYILTKRDFVW